MDVGVIGVGTMGKNHVRVYSELKSVDSVGVLTLTPQEHRKSEKSTVLLCIVLLRNCLRIPMR